MPTALPRRRPTAAHCRLAAVLLATVLAAGGARAEPPAAAADPVLKLLHERGLIPATGNAATESPLVRQVRDAASDLVLSAMNFLGVPYRRGGTSAEDGFDCSGFTRHVFENSLGLVLPRRADQQARDRSLLPIDRSELRPGDLVFFNTLRRAFSHVGIYIGDGKFIHAPRAGAQVRIEDMRAAYWTRRFNGARRADAVQAPTAGTVPGVGPSAAPAAAGAEAPPPATQP